MTEHCAVIPLVSSVCLLIFSLSSLSLSIVEVVDELVVEEMVVMVVELEVWRFCGGC